MALDLSCVSEGTDSHLISATHSLSTEDDPLDPHSEYVAALCRANSDQETSERTKVAQCESCSGQIQTAPGIIAWVQLPWRKARKLSQRGDDCRLTRRPLVRALFVSHLLPVWTRETLSAALRKRSFPNPCVCLLVGAQFPDQLLSLEDDRQFQIGLAPIQPPC